MHAVTSSLMVWTIHDPVIEDHVLLEQKFHDIRTAGFGGVAAFVRCSRYTWDQPPAMVALRRIGCICCCNNAVGGKAGSIIFCWSF